MVLVPSGMTIQLPVVSTGESVNLYIYRCTDSGE